MSEHNVKFDIRGLTITDNGHGQDIGPAPQWSTEPPTEPGWYWTKHKSGRVPGNTTLQFDTTPQVVRLAYCDGGGFGAWGWYLNGADPDDFEWWPIPISEPPR